MDSALGAAASGQDSDHEPILAGLVTHYFAAGRKAGQARAAPCTLAQMTKGFEPEWSAIVCRRLDALFYSTAAGFSRSSPAQPVTGVVDDLLWEADPLQFAERYPDSGIVESYGEQWPAPCIDYWVYVDVETRMATLSTEGWSHDNQEIALSGNGAEDADRLHEHLARILHPDV